jgi:hypothetical protein
MSGGVSDPAMFHAARLTQESRIRVALSGGRVAPENLDYAIRYFLEGPGKDLPRPCTRADWQYLLLSTGIRRPPVPAADLAGDFTG